MSDGLDRLESARSANRGRRIPPSRNGPRETPVRLAETAVQETAGTSALPSPPTPLRRSEVIKVAEAVTRRSIHLSPNEDSYLEAVFLAGRQDPKGRFDASRSAVVRLALERLGEEMTPEQVVAALRSRTPVVGVGRPRR